VSAKLGIPFDEVEPLNESGDCGKASSDYGVALVVSEPGGVQYFVVSDPAIPFVPDGGGDVRVGTDMDALGDLYPSWYFEDSNLSLAGGPRGLLVPAELNSGPDSAGRAVLFEGTPDGVVRQYRVGVTAYALHTDYCTTPA
jgi:hypothetical protein